MPSIGKRAKETSLENDEGNYTHNNIHGTQNEVLGLAPLSTLA